MKPITVYRSMTDLVASGYAGRYYRIKIEGLGVYYAGANTPGQAFTLMKDFIIREFLEDKTEISLLNARGLVEALKEENDARRAFAEAIEGETSERK